MRGTGCGNTPTIRRIPGVGYREEIGPLRTEVAPGVGGWIGLIFTGRRLAYAVQRETWGDVDALVARHVVELLTTDPQRKAAAEPAS